MAVRILIADDNAGVRRALTQLLADIRACEFIETENGRDAVAKAQNPGVDLAVLDLAMPVMDGLTAAREILKVRPELPIFLCTMHWSPHLELEAKTAGIRKVVSKAQSSILIAAVRELLGKDSTAPEPAADSSSAVTLPRNPTLLPAGASAAQHPGNGDTIKASGAEPDPSKARRIG